MSLTETELNIYTDTRDWLAEEIKTRGKAGRYIVKSVARARTERYEIVSMQLPSLWADMQEVRTERNKKVAKIPMHLKLRVGQRALLACAFAQEAYAFDAAVRNIDPRVALHQSFDGMDLYINRLRSIENYRLPDSSLLDEPLKEAVVGYMNDRHAYDEPLPRLQATVGLTIATLHEQTNSDVLLPIPGLRQGELRPWKQPRLH